MATKKAPSKADGAKTAAKTAAKPKAPPKGERPPSPPPQRAEALRNFVRARGEDYLQDPNITSIGIARGENGEECIQFTVAKKVSSPEGLESLGTSEIPKSIVVDGVPVATSVVERSYRTSAEPVRARAKDPRKTRLDPMQPGISVCHPTGTAGTLGMIVYEAQSGEPCILSNWHVLHTPKGKLGDSIVQPGPFDDNRVERNEAGTLVRSHLGAAGDCAIARIEGRDFDASIFELDVKVTQFARPAIDDIVVKSGRTTGVTRGRVRRTDVMVKIDYGGNVGEKAIGGFEIGLLDGDDPNYEVSMGGDSGSVWVIGKEDGGKITATDIMAGLHFAGETDGQTDEHAIACYAHSVFEKLEIQLEPRQEAVEAQATFGSGYDQDFLGTGSRVHVPSLTGNKAQDVVKVAGKNLIPYTHFSVCQSESRRFAHFVAWNIDGSSLKAYGRKGLNFKLDPRVDEGAQVGDDVYARNKLDRGHVARRADLVWGPKAEAQRANQDSFYFTNITPQHQAFNQSGKQGLWGELENAIFEEVDVSNLRLSLLGGPIFRTNDPTYRGIKIPRSFWKLIAYIDGADDTLKVKAYVLSQNDLLSDIEAFELDQFRLYQVGLDELTKQAKLTFAVALQNADTAAQPERIGLEGAPQRRVREIRNRAELLG